MPKFQPSYLVDALSDHSDSSKGVKMIAHTSGFAGALAETAHGLWKATCRADSQNLRSLAAAFTNEDPGRVESFQRWLFNEVPASSAQMIFFVAFMTGDIDETLRAMDAQVGPKSDVHYRAFTLYDAKRVPVTFARLGDSVPDVQHAAPENLLKPVEPAKQEDTADGSRGGEQTIVLRNSGYRDVEFTGELLTTHEFEGCFVAIYAVSGYHHRFVLRTATTQEGIARHKVVVCESSDDLIDALIEETPDAALLCAKMGVKFAKKLD